jgi:large subunit ribosomal protein L10
MATQKKIETVKVMADKVGRTKSIIFAQYGGIKHKQLETLRKAMKNVDAEFMVTKNTLMKRALGDQANDAAPFLKSNTASVFSYKDEVTGLKELMKFFKTAGTGKVKGGLLGNTVLSEKDVERLSKLPAREVVLAQLAGQLLAPVQGLHYALRWNLQALVVALAAVKAAKK